MSDFEVQRWPFTPEHLQMWSEADPRYLNWPVVYILDDEQRIYVGETSNTALRMRQHLSSEERRSLKFVRLILDDSFNKSVCLDLEAHLIDRFFADGKYTVLNRNRGMVNANYFGRDMYRQKFEAIYEALRKQNIFTQSMADIENSELFKLSPFKALNRDQTMTMADILDGLLHDLHSGDSGTIVIQGDTGTGKTIVAVTLLKLLHDIANVVDANEFDGDALFSEYFNLENRQLLSRFRIGLVVPQQALRASLKQVFEKTPGLHKTMVLTPFDVGKSFDRWHLLVVDESHRLSQRANQPSGPLNKSFGEINERLFGADAHYYTQADWIRAQSDYQVFLLDSEQSVRPADLSPAQQHELTRQAHERHRHYQLVTQMRVQGGTEYISYIRSILRGDLPSPQVFQEYEFRMFDNLGEMHDTIRARDRAFGLARLVAGFAWKWVSKRDAQAADIEIDGRRLQWNRTPTDWIHSPGAVDQVGSIHTVQGYDLNYTGVIIGPDLRFDLERQRLVFDRASYYDKKGMENNPKLGIRYTDEDLRRFVSNIYCVLLTRGIRGTFIYVVDLNLRAHLARFMA